MGKIALASVLKAVYSPNSLFSFEEKDLENNFIQFRRKRYLENNFIQFRRKRYLENNLPLTSKTVYFEYIWQITYLSIFITSDKL